MRLEVVEQPRHARQVEVVLVVLTLFRVPLREGHVTIAAHKYMVVGRSIKEHLLALGQRLLHKIVVAQREFLPVVGVHAVVRDIVHARGVHVGRGAGHQGKPLEVQIIGDVEALGEPFCGVARVNLPGEIQLHIIEGHIERPFIRGPRDIRDGQVEPHAEDLDVQVRIEVDRERQLRPFVVRDGFVVAQRRHVDRYGLILHREQREIRNLHVFAVHGAVRQNRDINAGAGTEGNPREPIRQIDLAENEPDNVDIKEVQLACFIVQHRLFLEQPRIEIICGRGAHVEIRHIGDVNGKRVDADESQVETRFHEQLGAEVIAPVAGCRANAQPVVVAQGEAALDVGEIRGHRCGAQAHLHNETTRVAGAATRPPAAVHAQVEAGRGRGELHNLLLGGLRRVGFAYRAQGTRGCLHGRSQCSRRRQCAGVRLPLEDLHNRAARKGVEPE